MALITRSTLLLRQRLNHLTQSEYMTSCGVDTDDLPLGDSQVNSDDDDFDADADPQASADLIRRAEARLHSQLRPDVYERRVAIREMKTIIESVRRDVGVAARDESGLQRWLTAPETDDTEVQFKCLLGEFRFALNEESRIDTMIQLKCQQLRERWSLVEYYPADELETAVNAGGKRVKRCVLAVKSLDAMLDAWSDDVDDKSPGPTSDHQGSGFDDVFLRSRLADVLSGLNIPAAIQAVIVRQAESGARLRSTITRASLSTSEYDMLLSSVNELGRAPPTDAADDGAPPPDDWREDARALLKRCRRWELFSGVPLFLPPGVSSALVHDATGHLDDGVPFTDRLSAALKRMR